MPRLFIKFTLIFSNIKDFSQDPKLKFTSLAHLLNAECLKESYRELHPYAAPGIDRVSYGEYGKRLDENIANLVERLKAKRYKALDIRRVIIPKPEGGRRRIDAKLGSDGRLTLSGWLLNQLDLAGLAWRTKNSLCWTGSIGEMALYVKGKGSTQHMRFLG